MIIRNSVKMLCKNFVLTEPSVSLKSIKIHVISHCTPIFSPVSEECKISDKRLIYYVEITLMIPNNSVYIRS